MSFILFRDAQCITAIQWYIFSSSSSIIILWLIKQFLLTPCYKLWHSSLSRSVWDFTDTIVQVSFVINPKVIPEIMEQSTSGWLFKCMLKYVCKCCILNFIYVYRYPDSIQFNAVCNALIRRYPSLQDRVVFTDNSNSSKHVSSICCILW